MYCDRRTGPLVDAVEQVWVSCSINHSKPSGDYMYRQFNIQQFYVLPTQCTYVFGVDLRNESDYFPIQR